MIKESGTKLFQPIIDLLALEPGKAIIKFHNVKPRVFDHDVHTSILSPFLFPKQDFFIIFHTEDGDINVTAFKKKFQLED